MPAGSTPRWNVDVKGKMDPAQAKPGGGAVLIRSVTVVPVTFTTPCVAGHPVLIEETITSTEVCTVATGGSRRIESAAATDANAVSNETRIDRRHINPSIRFDSSA